MKKQKRKVIRDDSDDENMKAAPSTNDGESDINSNEVKFKSDQSINSNKFLSGQIYSDLNNSQFKKSINKRNSDNIIKNKSKKINDNNEIFEKPNSFNLLDESIEEEKEIDDDFSLNENNSLFKGLNQMMKGEIFKNNLMNIDNNNKNQKNNNIINNENYENNKNIINNINDNENQKFYTNKSVNNPSFMDNQIGDFMRDNPLFVQNSFLKNIENNNVKKSVLNEENSLNMSQSFGKKLIINPRDYQIKIYNEAKDTNSIVFMETGKGKTFIAIMLMSRLLGIDMLDNKENINKMAFNNKKIIFLVCDTPLINQQANAIKTILGIDVGILQGKKQKKTKNDYLEFRKVFQNKNIFVAIHSVIYKLLSTGFLKFSEIDMLIFDECHHADSNHPYNDIMNEFYFFYKKINPNYKLPLILGLTASPLKSSLKGDIESNAISGFITLSENLDSQIIIDPDFFSVNFDINDENDIETILEKEKFIKVDDDTENENYQFLIKLLISRFFVNFTHLCFYELKKNNNEKYNLIYSDDLEKNYNTFITYKFESDSNEDYNDVINRNIDLYNFKNLDIIFLIYEKIQKHIFLILQNLDLKSLTKYFNRLGKIFTRFIEQKDPENLKLELQLEENNRDDIKNINIKTMKSLKSMVNIMENKLNELDELKQISYQSHRIIQMFKQLELIFSKNKESKIIIFLENRIVAFYLDDVVSEFLKDKYEEKYKCASVIGINSGKNKSMINPTNTLKKLNEKIEGFNKGEYNILIGTSTIEEGLDIQSCNVVMVFTEIRTPKSYIQMKGRARLKNSELLTFSFNPEKTKKNILDFIKLNVIMKKLFKNSIKHDFRRKDFYKYNKGVEKYYIIDENTQAKITLNNCSGFYNEILQLLNNYNYKIKCEIKVEAKKTSSGPNEFLYVGRIKIESSIKGLHVLNNFQSQPKTSKFSAENECKLEFIKKLKELGRIDEHIKVKKK